MSFNCSLFLQKAPLYLFDIILNMPLIFFLWFLLQSFLIVWSRLIKFLEQLFFKTSLMIWFFLLSGLSPATSLKKRLWHWCFPENFAKFLRKPFSWNTSGRLLLDHSNHSHYFHENYISSVSFNLYLFKGAIFDVI